MKRVFALMVLLGVLAGSAAVSFAQGAVSLWFPPDWSNKADKAREIVMALAEESGIEIRPRIASSYPDLIAAFSTNDPNLVYGGSFVQAIIKGRDLGTPLVQAIDGKELYSGILVFPKGENPQEILNQAPEQVAFAVGASSGESTAKAATAGKAAVGVPNHGAACNAVMAGRAKAAVVKNFWWDANKDKFAELAAYAIPGLSENKNPDNVLTASKTVSADVQQKIAAAAGVRKEVFGAKEMKPLDGAALDFSLDLMKKGGIDPKTYSW